MCLIRKIEPAETWVPQILAFPDFGRGFASHTKRKEEVA
jgi:hypothetical protein